MKNQIFKLLPFLLIMITFSCSNDDATIENLKNVTDCEMVIEPETLVAICLDGTDSALPNEVIKFASTFYSKNENPSNTEFLWTIESGSMEIVNIENSVDGSLAKSIVTIKFNSDFSGNGLVQVNAANASGTGNTEHDIELE